MLPSMTLSIPRRLNPERLGMLLSKVLQRCFQGRITLHPHSAKKTFVVDHHSQPGLCTLQVRLSAPQRIEFLRLVEGPLTAWVEQVLLDEIGSTLHGRYTLTGLTERWKPRTGRYPTFRSFFEELSGGTPIGRVWPEAVELMFLSFKLKIPKDLHFVLE